MTAFEFLNDLLKPEALEDAFRIDTNELVFPTGENADNGNPIYFYIKCGHKAAKDTKRTQAFNLDNALAAYNDKQVAKATNARKAKAVKVPLSAQYHDSIIQILTNAPEGLTAQEIAAQFTEGEQPTWNVISAGCKTLVKDGRLTRFDKDGKAGYKLA